jgi:hypothetical protein
MGRVHELDERGEHEGHLVGYVPRDWVPAPVATAIGSSRRVAVLERYSSRGVLRELGLVADDREYDVHGICVIGYACACGWRSPYRELGTPFEWSPCIVLSSEWLEDLLAQKWWKPHVAAEVRRGTRLNQQAVTENAEFRAVHRHHTVANNVHVALDLPREVAVDLLTLLNSLGNSDYVRLTKHLTEQQADSANLGLCELGEELELKLRDSVAPGQ